MAEQQPDDFMTVAQVGSILKLNQQCETVTALGERFGVSHQRVSQIMRDVTKLVDRIRP